VLCEKGRSQAVAQADADRLLKAGATLGVCAWRK
jgi:hypothetical protein